MKQLNVEGTSVDLAVGNFFISPLRKIKENVCVFLSDTGHSQWSIIRVFWGQGITSLAPAQRSRGSVQFDDILKWLTYRVTPHY